MDDKYLLFTTGGRRFSLGFSDVKEIIPASKPEPIPDFPDYVLGTVIHLGKNIPVLSLRKRFCYDDKPLSDRDCIIVTAGEKSVGLLCDSIEDFMELTENDIQPPPDINSEASARFLKGQFLLEGEKTCYILDPLKVIKPQDEQKVLTIE